MGFANLINGHRYSYASLEISIKAATSKPQIFIDIDSIEYSESLEIALRYGTSRGPIGSTAGIYKPEECTMKMGLSTFASFISQIGPGWLGINCLINLAYADIGEPVTTDTIPCRIVGRSNAHEGGSAESLVTTVKFLPIDSIYLNGIPSLLNRVF